MVEGIERRTMDNLRGDYDAEFAEFRLAYSRGGCIVGCILVAAGVGLDHSFYPEYVLPFGIARGVTTLILLGVLGVLYTEFGRRHVQGLTLLWLALPQAMICGLILFGHGAGGSYVFGLTLALYAGGLLLPMGSVQSFTLGAGTTLGYYFAGLLDSDSTVPHSTLVGNAIFLAFSAIAASVGAWFNERGRRTVFDLQRQVRAKNEVLEDTVQKLAAMQGMLLQKERMASLGTLSAGLMHEVNNPINYSIMALNAALLEPSVVADETVKEMVSDARGGMLRIQGIVADLKTFAYQKPNGDAGRVFSFKKAVQSALRLTNFELKGVAVETEVPMDSRVCGDEPAVISVLVNMLGNAAFALAAKTGAPDHAPLVQVSAQRVDDSLVVQVRDNGVGITAANLPRVFDPFFTTRDVGQGLGLGLAVSYAVVQRHGGTLRVASEPGEWTEFSFSLPLAADHGELVPTRDAVPSAVGLVGGGFTLA